MTKKRRTRREKIIASSRRDFSGILLDQNLIESATHATIEKTQSAIVLNERNYSYVSLDIKKTLIITSLLTALNIIFYLTLKFKYIIIPGVGF